MYAFEGSPGREVNSVSGRQPLSPQEVLYKGVPDWYDDMCLYQRLAELVPFTMTSGRVTDQACGYFSTFGGPGSALKEATSA